MNVINEFKMCLRNFLIPFYQSEIKVAFGACYEIKMNLRKDINAYIIWPEISTNLERILILEPKTFIIAINKNKKSPRELFYLWCYNNSKDELQCIDKIQFSKRDGLETALEFLSKELNRMSKD
jgi:hypothetical protein